MKMNKILYVIGLCVLMLSCASKGNISSLSIKDYTKYVDPLIGTGGHGHVFVGASLPHGLVQLGPNNLSKGWDWCSGYNDSDSTIIGFAHTHLSGTGIADLGDILFMPVTGKVKPFKGTSSNLSSGYASLFSKQNQVVQPGYYSVILDRYQIKAELTTTARVGFHKYTYPEKADADVIIDLEEGTKSLNSRKGVISSSFRLVNDSTISGYRISDEWAMDHRVYFTAVFSRPIAKCEVYKENKLCNDTFPVTGKDIKVILSFSHIKNPLLVKTGISYVSEEGAAKNINSELNHWNFEKVKADARKNWNVNLSKIDFSSKDEQSMKIFYSALYHTGIAPSLFDDVDGSYRGADKQIHKAEGFVPYTVFSLWDTYRAVHPLYTLIDNRVSDYANTLLAIYDQQKTMPVWHLVGNETNCMVGVHSIPVVVDACLKGFNGINPRRAYAAVKSIEFMDVAGLKSVRENGYIPADKEPWSVAKG